MTTVHAQPDLKKAEEKHKQSGASVMSVFAQEDVIKAEKRQRDRVRMSSVPAQ